MKKEHGFVHDQTTTEVNKGAKTISSLEGHRGRETKRFYFKTSPLHEEIETLYPFSVIKSLSLPLKA